MSSTETISFSTINPLRSTIGLRNVKPCIRELTTPNFTRAQFGLTLLAEHLPCAAGGGWGTVRLPLDFNGSWYMHKKFFIVTAILLAVAAGLTASVYAQGPHRGFGPRSGWMLNHLSKELNLTEAQQTQIKNILADERARTKPLMEQLRQNA